MNIKFIVHKVEPLLDAAIFNDTFKKRVGVAAEKEGLLLPLPQVGAGYWQWNLPGDGWTSFSACSEEEKNTLAREHSKRCANLRTALKNAPAVEVVLTVPSEECIYFRKQGNTLQIALVAWAFKFHNIPGTRELTTTISREDAQDVRIGFMWGEEFLAGFNFKLNGQPRQTAADGFFKSDGPLVVGSSYPVEIPSGKTFELTVELGKPDYFYDLSQYFYVDVTVTRDGAPASDMDCTLRYNGQVFNLKTDGNGVASQRVLHDKCLAWQEDSSDECVMECGGEVQRQRSSVPGQNLSFAFDFTSAETIVEPKPKPEPEPNPEPEPEPQPEPKPEYVYIYLKDYEGYPLTDLNFILKTKSCGDVSLKTDKDGGCIIPKEWMTDKEKFSVSFTITPEYQQTHDIHRVKSKKKRR